MAPLMQALAGAGVELNASPIEQRVHQAVAIGFKDDVEISAAHCVEPGGPSLLHEQYRAVAALHNKSPFGS